MNNNFYIAYIDEIRNKLNILHKHLFNISIHTIEVTNSNEPNKHKDDTMALQNLLWKQKVSEYRDTQKKINRNINYTPKEYTIIDNEDELLESIKKESYKTTWNRLDTFQKKEKVREFIEEKKNKIQEHDYKLILDSLQDIIKKGNSKKIVYNNIDSIQSIWCIHYNNEQDVYTFHL